MDEKPRAPRTNAETAGLSDPKQPGFELDSSDGKAHDSPAETTQQSLHTSPAENSMSNLMDYNAK